MPFAEKSAWVMLILAVTTYAGYGIAVGAGAAYVPAMLSASGSSVALSIVAHLLLGRREKDQRDTEIARFGDYVGHAFVVIGGAAALLMAMRAWEYAWIANALYLGFVLSAAVGAIARICAYRFGFPRW